MQVHRATVDDWREVRALRLAALADTPDAFAITLAEERAKPDEFWQHRLRDGPATTLVARVDGGGVGLSVVAPTHDGDAGLYAVWVAPEARGRGVGEALITEAIAVAQERGYRRLVLEVGDHNLPAIGLYARMGFERTGRTGRLPPPQEDIMEHERALVL